MRIKLLIFTFATLFLPLLGCSKIYSTSPFSDSAWPTASILRIDYKWPLEKSDLPPSVAIFDTSVDGTFHTFFIVNINAFKFTSRAPGIFVQFGWSTQQISLDDQILPPNTFSFVSGFPLASTIWYQKAQPGDPYCQTQSSFVLKENTAEYGLAHSVLSVGTDVANHFMMYPNYEQPFTADLRQRIQQFMKDMFSYPESIKSNGC